MILGSIHQPQLRAFLSQTPVLQRAFSWIGALPTDPAMGITELEGPDLYVNLHGYETRTREQCRWESHRHTADLQFCLKGSELIDWSPVRLTRPSISYEPGKDFEFWPDDVQPVNTVRLEPGTFVIFLPGELHRPMVSDGKSATVQKGVFKIHARFLPVHEVAS